MTTAQKAKRKLFNFDFSNNGANVSLVGPAVGSGANSRKVLAIKSTNVGIQPTDAVEVQKALEQITVSLSMEEFLRKFFGMWSDDAETLTALLGYQTEYEYWKEQNSENVSPDNWYEEYMTERLSKFQLMKSLHDNPNQIIADEDYIAIVKFQSEVEALLQQNEDDPLKIQVEKARYEQLEQTEQAHEAVVAEAAQLKVEKAALQAELDAVKADIQKAKEEKEAAELAAFTETLKDLVGEAQLQTVAKSLFVMKATAPEAAETVIEQLKASKALVEKSDLFEEQTGGEEMTTEEIRKAAMKAVINKPY